MTRGSCSMDSAFSLVDEQRTQRHFRSAWPCSITMAAAGKIPRSPELSVLAQSSLKTFHQQPVRASNPGGIDELGG